VFPVTDQVVEIGVRMTCPIELQVNPQIPAYTVRKNSKIFEITSAHGKLDRLSIQNGDLTEVPLYDLKVYRYLDVQCNLLEHGALNRMIAQLPKAPPSEYGNALICLGYNPITKEIEHPEGTYRAPDNLDGYNYFSALAPSGWSIYSVM
jgi:hypothetical protein